VVRLRALASGLRDPEIQAVPLWLQAALWGLLAGSALVLGAAAGSLARVPARIVAGVMSFGSGVLISALSFDLMDEAFRRGAFWAVGAGFLGGAAVYTAANLALARRGAKHRKRSDGAQPSEEQAPGSGLAIAVGALLDGIPESIAIGVTLLAGGGVSLAAVAAIFISNVPEGLSSSAGMKRAGRSKKYVFGVWTAIAVLSALAAALGAAVFGGLPPEAVAATLACAAGAILAMIADTMVPEAFAQTRDLAGFVTVAGFLAAFLLTKLGG
jgi:ZIP family zinc transporter